MQTKEIFNSNLKFREMAKKTDTSEYDTELYDLLYNYLAEYVHPNLNSFDSYHNGFRFNIAEIDKEGEAFIYDLFLLVIILEQTIGIISIDKKVTMAIQGLIGDVKELFYSIKVENGKSRLFDLMTQRLKAI